MKVIIGADHNGYVLKDVMAAHLRERDIEVEDLGTDGQERVLVERYALGVARAVAEGRVDTGVLVCGTGQGMAMFANRVKGARAALCNDIFTARMARQNNDANVLCVGSDITGTGHLLAVLDEWLATSYGGREDDMLDRLSQIDDERG